MCWTARDTGLGQHNAFFFLQIVYGILRVVACKLCERSKISLQSAHLKYDFDHDFLFIALSAVLAVIYELQCTFEEVVVEVV